MIDIPHRLFGLQSNEQIHIDSARDDDSTIIVF